MEGEVEGRKRWPDDHRRSRRQPTRIPGEILEGPCHLVLIIEANTLRVTGSVLANSISIMRRRRANAEKQILQQEDNKVQVKVLEVGDMVGN